MIQPKEFKKLLDFVYSAHQEHCIKKDFRQDGKVPFVVHPIWCAMVLLNDTRIPYEERRIGYQALLLHDVLEDTSLKLPEWVEPEVAKIVQEMTHETWEEEIDIDKKSSLVQLLKLVDKTATMYDENMRPDPQRRRNWRELIEKLLKKVEPNYKDSRVVSLAKTVLENTDW
ncbi:MAG: hypothetical protein AAB394_02045 [Patescibacteria group bacterium]